MNNIDNWILGISCSLIAGIIGYFSRSMLDILKEGYYPLTGLWEGYPTDQNIRKKDIIHMHQNGSIVKGEIKRLEPSNQCHREWYFIGRLIGHNFFAIFWPTDQMVLSYGCWYVHQIDDSTFQGFYLKLDDADGGKIRTVPITVKKIDSMGLLRRLIKVR